MFIAIDENENRIVADGAKKNTRYFCPVCKSEVCLRDGGINVAHFAHLSFKNCDDFTSDMSEWHRIWQSMFPLKNREHILRDENEIHRADVCCYGTVIEFQHSSITSEEFWRRNDFYTRLGYKVVWIFDVIDIFNGYDDSEGMYIVGDWKELWGSGDTFRWKYPWRFLKDFYPQDEKNIDIFFQTAPFGANPKDEDECYIEKVTWVNPNYKTMWGNFRTTSDAPANHKGLLQWLKERWKKEDSKVE